MTKNGHAMNTLKFEWWDAVFCADSGFLQQHCQVLIGQTYDQER